MPNYHIQTVKSKSDLKRFIELPWELYRNEAMWVPPLKSEVKKLLTPGRHPFWENAERELFLLLDGTTPVGRIAAIVDRNHNTYHSEQAGKWGFFECVNDTEASNLLFNAARSWLEERGMEYMHGPFNPSTNYEIGLLAEGWDSPPTLMMPFTPQYYMDLVEASGQTREKELYAYIFRTGWQLPDWLGKMARRVMKKNNVTLRKANKKRILDEVKLMNELYKEAWADNWGFIPASDAEIEIQAKELKPILDPEFAFFLYHGDEPVGVSVVLPDANYLLKMLNGKIGLSGIWKALRNKSKIPGGRYLLLGIKPEYQRLGVPLVAVDQVLRKGYERGWDYIEVSWTLEDNRMVNSLLDKLGGELYKRYRIYRKEF